MKKEQARIEKKTLYTRKVIFSRARLPDNSDTGTGRRNMSLLTVPAVGRKAAASLKLYGSTNFCATAGN